VNIEANRWRYRRHDEAALSLGYPVILVSDGHSTMDTAALKAPPISAQINKALSAGDFGSKIRLIPAADLRIEA
jgi:hypothetical protein